MAHLEGMSRRLKLLLDCVSSPDKGWEALSKMKIGSVFFHFLYSNNFRRQSTSWMLYHGFILSSCFLMCSKKYVWICHGQLHSAPQWMQSHIIFSHLICLTVLCIHSDRTDSRLTPESHLEKKQQYNKCVRYRSVHVSCRQVRQLEQSNPVFPQFFLSGFNMQVALRVCAETSNDVNPNSWSFSTRTKWTDSNM